MGKIQQGERKTGATPPSPPKKKTVTLGICFGQGRNKTEVGIYKFNHTVSKISVNFQAPSSCGKYGSKIKIVQVVMLLTNMQLLTIFSFNRQKKM